MSNGPRPPVDEALYALYDELDRLEELIEDMTELGVRSLEDAEARIAALNEQIDALEAERESGT